MEEIMSGEKDKPIGTAEQGYVAIGRAASRSLSEEEIQAGILRSMSEVVARPYNPNALRRPEKVGVANAPNVVDADEPKRGSGWQEERPLEPVVKPGSMEDRAISAMIDQALPPGGEKKDRK
jgi:hypothetical protein